MFKKLIGIMKNRKINHIVNNNNNSINLDYYIENVDSIITSISSGSFSELYSSYLLLLSDENDIVKRVLNAYKKLLSNVNLFKIEEIFRKNINQTSCYDYKFWNNFNLSYFIENTDLTPNEKIILLGVSSFHPNGYLREKAVKELCSFNTGDELKYIVVRANDWVNKINELATRICLERLNQENIELIIENAFYFIKLSETNRYNHQDILSKFNNLIKSNNNMKHLLLGVKHENPKVRKHFYLLLLEQQNMIINLNDMIQMLLQEKEPYLKYHVLTILLDKLTRDEFIKIYKFFLHDKSSNIRYQTLYMLEKYQIENRDEIIYLFIFDMSRSVREYARYLLNLKANYDFNLIYRNELNQNKNIYGSINGLAELRNSEDALLIENYLNSNKIKVVKAALNALAKLDFNQYKALILNYIKDDCVGVSKTAYLIVKNHIHEYLDCEIYDIYKTTNKTHVKCFSSQLLTSLSKWKALKYILVFLLDKDTNLQRLANESIQSWIINFNKTPINPTTLEIKDIKSLLTKLKDNIKEEQYQFLIFVTKNY